MFHATLLYSKKTVLSRVRQKKLLNFLKNQPEVLCFTMFNEVISKVRQNLAEKRLLMSWKW